MKKNNKVTTLEDLQGISFEAVILQYKNKKQVGYTKQISVVLKNGILNFSVNCVSDLVECNGNYSTAKQAVELYNKFEDIYANKAGKTGNTNKKRS